MDETFQHHPRWRITAERHVYIPDSCCITQQSHVIVHAPNISTAISMAYVKIAFPTIDFPYSGSTYPDIIKAERMEKHHAHDQNSNSELARKR